MRTRRPIARLAGLVLALGLPTAAFGWAGPRMAPDAAYSAAERSEEYRAGQRALDREEWEAAAQYFAQLIEVGGDEVDAALYWHAYAQLKRGHARAALDSVAELQRDFPESPWVDDAKALEVQASQWRDAEAEMSEDEELKLYILNNLIHVESERAMPVLEELLRGDQSERVKKRALFVVSQSSSPRAKEILAEAAKGSLGPGLAASAVEYLGLHGGEEVAPLLEEVYAGSRDESVKRKVLEMMMISGQKDRLLSVARDEGDESMRRRAIEYLGIMNAVPELRELYSQEQSTTLRRQIVEALFLAGESDILEEIAASDADPAIRRKAIESLGLMGVEKAGAVLKRLYETEQDESIRRQIIESFFLQGDHETLIEIARNETDPALRRKAIESLGLMGDEATDFLLEMLAEDNDDG